MKNRFNHKRNTSSLFRDTVNQLFIPVNDPAYAYIYLGMIMLIGLTLRLYLINDPIGYDEAYTFIKFSSQSFKLILADYHAPNNHILNSLLIGIVYRILGNHVWIVRVPALIAGVLGVPVSFFTARRFFSLQQSLAVSAALAVMPGIVAASANGRGYTLIILFSLLLANFAGIIVKGQSRLALAAYAVTGALGFYSIPIFLYPMAGISLWVAVTLVFSGDKSKNEWKRVRDFLLACAASGAFTVLLYSPVIIFGTGLNSIIANDIVKSQSWIDFLDNIVTRSSLTWSSWTEILHPAIRQIFLIGFLLSILLYRKISNQRLPMQVYLIAGAGIMLILQRVAPLPRIWGYLEMFYFFFSAVGLVGAGQLIFNALSKERARQSILTSMILLVVLLDFANVTMKTQSRQARLDRTVAPEQFAAGYLAEHLTDQDIIIAAAPTDIQTAYYLKVNGVPYEFFYQRDHPAEFQNAFVLVRTRGGEYGFDTLEKVLAFYKLQPSLAMDSSQQVFDYGPLLIYSIPAR